MPVKRIQPIGNSRGIILTSELKAAGLEEIVEVTVRGNEIVIGPPQRNLAPTPAQKPGKNRQSRREAMESTMSQYESALRRLADAGSQDGQVDGQMKVR
ncbi:MAG: hypothetical protein SFU56_15625 [Capsulimonadales bacterium]|nr:hypothetical protein [Capsulimonadales bacterium]